MVHLKKHMKSQQIPVNLNKTHEIPIESPLNLNKSHGIPFKVDGLTSISPMGQVSSPRAGAAP